MAVIISERQKHFSNNSPRSCRQVKAMPAVIQGVLLELTRDDPRPPNEWSHKSRHSVSAHSLPVLTLSVTQPDSDSV